MANLATMAANLKHGAHNGIRAHIGGGIFGPDECREAARALDAFPAMLAALHAACDQMEQCESMFRDDAEFMAALHRVQAAIAAATGERS